MDLVPYSALAMKTRYEESKFDKKVRVSSAQFEFIKQMKNVDGRYTLAGKLDEIINFYRKHNELHTRCRESHNPTNPYLPSP